MFTNSDTVAANGTMWVKVGQYVGYSFTEVA